jgi:hypothetical protein
MNDLEEDAKLKAEMDEILTKIDNILEKIESSMPHEQDGTNQE